MCKRLLPLLLALTLTACASGVRPTVGNLTIPEPPAQDMQTCPDLPQPESGKAGDLLANHVQVAKAYRECKARQQGLAKQFQAISKTLGSRHE